MGKTHVSKTLYCRGNSFKCNSLKQEAHIHQPTSWPVPHACVQPYHVGSGSHRQLFHPYRNSPLWHYQRVKEQGKLVSQRFFIAVGSAKHSFKHQLHTTHVGAVGWEPSTAVFPPHTQGSRIMGWCVCAPKDCLMKIVN